MKPNRFLLGTFLVLLLAKLVLPARAFASPLIWHQSFNSEYVFQDIKAAPSNSQYIYATLRSSTGSGLLRSVDAGQSFSLVFPITSNRDVNAIAISFSNLDKFCISTYEQGVFCTNNGPTSLSNFGWTNSSLNGKKARFVTVDPSNDSVYYVGTGENNNDGGIYKTIDGGQSWIKVGDSSYGSKNCLNIVVDHNNSQRVLAGSDFNLYVSVDAGQNWAPLSIGYTNSPATLFDKLNHSVFYSAWHLSGVFRTTDNGLNWHSYNSGIENAMIFRLVEDNEHELFGTRRNSPGGLWNTGTADQASWQNIGDPVWDNRNTWGLDVGGNRIFVAVEGLGIYYADLEQTPPPPPTPNPVVIIPGFGGSWSYRGLIENQPTTNADWQMLPFFADNIYGPLISSFEAGGFNKNTNLFIFAYDFRKSITDSAQALKQFLDEEVIPKNHGKKVDLVTHSMGGLVARQCAEKVAGCLDSINKIVTAGSPHQGTLKAYKLWEGGVVDDDNVVSRTIEEAAIDSLYPFFMTRKDIIQNRFPGARDFLPTFDYIFGKPYSLMSSSAKNPNLTDLYPPSPSFTATLLASSGNDQPTENQFVTTGANWWEKSLGLWVDGRPVSATNSVGDGTVLQKSSEILAGTNKYSSLKHVDYFRNQESINNVFSFLGLASPQPIDAEPTISSLLTFIIHSPATITVADENGNNLGYMDSGKAVFIPNPAIGNYHVTVTGTDPGNYVLEVLNSQNGALFRNTFSGLTSVGKQETIEFTNSGGNVSPINESSIGDLYRSLLLRLSKVDNSDRIVWRVRSGVEGFWWRRTFDHDEDTEKERFDDFRNNFRFTFLLSAYRSIGKILSKEIDPAKRENLKEAEKDLAQIIVKIDPDLRFSKNKIQQRIDQLRKTLSKEKKKPSVLDGINRLAAQEYLDEAQANLNNGNNKIAYILCFLTTILA